MPSLFFRKDHYSIASNSTESYILIEFVVRQALEASKQKLAGLYDGNPQRATERPSVEQLLMAFQRTIEKSKGRTNVQTLFGVHQIPSDNHIRDLLDPLKPALVSPVFEQALQMLESGGQLNSFRTLADNMLIAMDGTEYFSSSQIHCPQCSTRKLKSGEMRYFHSVVTPVIVSPNRTEIIPLVPEFVVPQSHRNCSSWSY
jgi:hypothetical protein